MKKVLEADWFASLIQLVTLILTAGNMIVTDSGVSVGSWFFIKKPYTFGNRYFASA